jgi:hypothetical protein
MYNTCPHGSILPPASVIMELLDEWHQDGYKSMMPSTEKGRGQFNLLSRLEREYVSSVVALVTCHVLLKLLIVLLFIYIDCSAGGAP